MSPRWTWPTAKCALPAGTIASASRELFDVMRDPGSFYSNPAAVWLGLARCPRLSWKRFRSHFRKRPQEQPSTESVLRRATHKQFGQTPTCFLLQVRDGPRNNLTESPTSIRLKP